MRFSHISLIAVMLVVIAVALAGCASTGPAPQSTGTTPAAGTSPGSSSSVSQTAAGSGSGGSNLFGGLNYNWVEYKMSTGAGSDAMTIYMKFDKVTGKCTMRFEGAGAANMPSGMQEMDCSAKPGQATQSNPNQVSSDAVVTCSPLDESVTVPAGTFSATKCTVTSKGYTSTTWVAKGRFMVKMEGSAEGGSTSMVLNAYG